MYRFRGLKVHHLVYFDHQNFKSDPEWKLFELPGDAILCSMHHLNRARVLWSTLAAPGSFNSLHRVMPVPSYLSGLQSQAPYGELPPLNPGQYLPKDKGQRVREGRSFDASLIQAVLPFLYLSTLGFAFWKVNSIGQKTKLLKTTSNQTITKAPLHLDGYKFHWLKISSNFKWCTALTYPYPFPVGDFIILVQHFPWKAA